MKINKMNVEKNFVVFLVLLALIEQAKFQWQVLLVEPIAKKKENRGNHIAGKRKGFKKWFTLFK